MNPQWWQKPACIICDYWWLILLLFFLVILGASTPAIWMPRSDATLTGVAQIINTRTSKPTGTPIVQATILLNPTATLGTGDVQISLRWNDENDLDLWVTDPMGERVYYANPTSASGAVLDRDSNLGCMSNVSANPVENIYWAFGVAPSGSFIVQVDYYMHCEDELEATDYEVSVLVDGHRTIYSGTIAPFEEPQTVTTFNR